MAISWDFQSCSILVTMRQETNFTSEYIGIGLCMLRIGQTTRGFSFLTIAANLYEFECEVEQNIAPNRMIFLNTPQQILYGKTMHGVDV